jgi:hypothetical protein
MNRNMSLFIVIGSLAVFLGGVYYLLLIGYQAEQFPEYSSRNTGRRGVQALINSLRSVDGLHVRRNFSNLPQLNNGTRETIFLVGVTPDQLKQDTFGRTLTDLLNDRDRVVLSLTPVIPWFEQFEKPFTPRPPDRTIVMNEAEIQSSSSALSGITPAGTVENNALKQASRTSSSRLSPPTLPIRSRVNVELSDDWNTHYELNDQPVLAEHKGHRGELVLLTGSYLFTNHALRDHRVPELLSYAVGNSQRVVFDETHLSIRSKPGIMNLAREYGLTLFVVALLGLGGLYLWKNSSSLVPPYPQRSWEPEQQAMMGKDEHLGLYNLIKSRISSEQLLQLCLDEYRKDVDRGWIRDVNLEEAEQSLQSGSGPDKEEQLVDTYRELSRLLHFKTIQHDEQR